MGCMQWDIMHGTNKLARHFGIVTKHVQGSVFNLWNCFEQIYKSLNGYKLNSIKDIPTGWNGTDFFG